MVKAVHFGAGNIGRGFIGAVLAKNGYEVCFIDVNQQLIEQLNQRGMYRYSVIGENDVREVFGASGILSSDEQQVIQAIEEADIITTSVGVSNLAKIANVLAKGLVERLHKTNKKIDVIANENVICATDLLKEQVWTHLSDEEKGPIEEMVGFVNSAIDRQALSTTDQEEVIPLVESYYEWVVDHSERKTAGHTDLKGAIYVEQLMPYIERKLYIVNAEHAVSAYYGQLLGKKTVQEALQEKEVEQFVYHLMKENAEYLKETYQMDEEELEAFIQKTIRRHKNPSVSDPVIRVGRSPLRKLGKNERIAGPLHRLQQLELPTYYGEKAVAIVLQFHNEEDDEAIQLQKELQEIGVKEVVKEYSDLQDEAMLSRIEKEVIAFKKTNKKG